MYCRQIAPIYPVHLHNADGSYRLDALNNKQYDPGYYKDDEGVTISTRNQYVDRHVIWENELSTEQNHTQHTASYRFCRCQVPERLHIHSERRPQRAKLRADLLRQCHYR